MSAAGIEGAGRDARRLMASALGIAPDRLALHIGDTLDPVSEAAFFDAVARRAERRPLSHLLGGRWFRGCWFRVTPDVLDPRPETETLVDLALAEPFSEVLDLGTGSGCILVTLLAERPGATGIGADISTAALDVAEENARIHHVADRAAFESSDWYAAIGGRFDLIVSNPPYIALLEMADLQPEVRDWEPRIALTDEGDGLAAYRAIASGAPDHLVPGGRLLVEIGAGQGRAVSGIFRSVGLKDVQVHSDLDGRDRVVSARSGAT